MLRRREGLSGDIQKILAACAKRGVAVEINANPYRADLDCYCVRLTNSGSPVLSRNRASARLIADGLSPSRWAARAIESPPVSGCAIRLTGQK